MLEYKSDILRDFEVFAKLFWMDIILIFVIVELAVKTN